MDEVKTKKKKNSFLRTVSYIAYSIALILLIIGIIICVKFSVDVFDSINDMVDDFDGFLRNDFLEFKLVFLIFFTSIIFTVWATFLQIIASIYENKNKQKIVAKVEKIENIEDELNKDNETENSKIFCAYCGSQLKVDETKCPNCGASKKLKK